MPCLDTKSMVPQVLLMYPGTRPTEKGGTLWTPPEYRNPTQATTRPERSRAVSLVTSLRPSGLAAHLRTKDPTPPRALYALLSAWGIGGGLAPTLLLLDCLRRFSRLPAGEQFSTEVVALPFGRFAPPALLIHPFAQRTLRPFAAGTFGAELFPGLLQLVGRAPELSGDSRASEGSCGGAAVSCRMVVACCMMISSLRRFESGHQKPQPRTVRDLARALRVPEWQLDPAQALSFEDPDGSAKQREHEAAAKK